jgi:hypothetical protein
MSRQIVIGGRNAAASGPRLTTSTATFIGHGAVTTAGRVTPTIWRSLDMGRILSTGVVAQRTITQQAAIEVAGKG